MTGWGGLDRLLDVDPRDAGCEHAMHVLHVYAELAAEGGDPEGTYPDVAAHLVACGPCSEDLTGLLELLRTGHADSSKFGERTVTDTSHPVASRSPRGPEEREPAQDDAQRQ